MQWRGAGRRFCPVEGMGAESAEGDGRWGRGHRFGGGGEGGGFFFDGILRFFLLGVCCEGTRWDETPAFANREKRHIQKAPDQTVKASDRVFAWERQAPERT